MLGQGRDRMASKLVTRRDVGTFSRTLSKVVAAEIEVGREFYSIVRHAVSGLDNFTVYADPASTLSQLNESDPQKASLNPTLP